MFLKSYISVLGIFALASFLISFAFSNILGIVFFGTALLYDVIMNARGEEPKRTFQLLNLGTFVYAINSFYNVYTMWDIGALMVAMQALNGLGALNNMYGNVVYNRFEQNPARVKICKDALHTMLANPGFWFAITGAIMSVVALLTAFQSQSGVIVIVLTIVAIAMMVYSVVISTRRMLMASADQISIKDINDGRSNMWIVYSNAVITVIVAIGLVTQYQSEMVYFLISQLCF